MGIFGVGLILLTKQTMRITETLQLLRGIDRSLSSYTIIYVRCFVHFEGLLFCVYLCYRRTPFFVGCIKRFDEVYCNFCYLIFMSYPYVNLIIL